MVDSRRFLWLLLLSSSIHHVSASAVVRGSSEVVVPGSGHVQRLPHNLRPPLQESQSLLSYPRSLRLRTRFAAVGTEWSRASSTTSLIPSSNKIPGSSEMTHGLGRELNRSEIGAFERGHDVVTQNQTILQMTSSNFESIPLFHGRYRKRREDLPSVRNSTERKNESLSANGTLVGNNGHQSRAISDKEIVIIVICCAIGLVICLLAAALLAKFYWNKRHDDGGGYHGVLQKDTTENSPSDDQPSTNIPGSQKDKDCRVHSNMFAQIDEMDEDSCSISPVSKSRRLSSLQNGENGETKPLLTTCSLPTPSSNMEDTDSKLSENEVAGNRISSFGNGKGEEKDVSIQDGMVASCNKAAVIETVDVICADVEDVPTSHAVEPEPRIYCRTGLSQSDYSLSSFTSVNPSYRYGNQVGYMGGYYGYPSDEATTPDVDFDAEDELLLPPPEFDFNPLTFNVPIATEDSNVTESLAMIGDIPPPIDDGTILEMESPLDFGQEDDSELLSSVGRWIDPSSIAVDNVSNISTGVNVDESDVADCGACEEDADEPEITPDGQLEEGSTTCSSISSHVSSALPVEHNAKDVISHQELQCPLPSPICTNSENVPLANHSFGTGSHSASLNSKDDTQKTGNHSNSVNNEEKPIPIT